MVKQELVQSDTVILTLHQELISFASKWVIPSLCREWEVFIRIGGCLHVRVEHQRESFIANSVVFILACMS